MPLRVNFNGGGLDQLRFTDVKADPTYWVRADVCHYLLHGRPEQRATIIIRRQSGPANSRAKLLALPARPQRTIMRIVRRIHVDGTDRHDGVRATELNDS